MLVVNKPKGMVVHPAAGHYSGTLVNALMYHCKGSLSGINGCLRPGIVHRIDMDTTGSLIVCKNDIAHTSIAAQLKEHSIVRRYRAIVWGVIKEEEGCVDVPIGRHPSDRKKWRQESGMGKRLSRIIGFWSVSVAIPISNAGWKPDGRTKSECIWIPSGTLFWEIRFMGTGNALFSFRGRPCMP